MLKYNVFHRLISVICRLFKFFVSYLNHQIKPIKYKNIVPNLP
jgi:hypothetical protein